MADTPQSPLAMLVLVTPYTVLYIVNQLFLQGILDKVHYLFFELIFVLAFRKVFGLPDLTERFFPSQRGPTQIQPAQGKKPLKTNIANYPILNSSSTLSSATLTSCATLAGTPLESLSAVMAANSTKTTASVKTTCSISPKSTKQLAKSSTAKPTPYAEELNAMEKQFMTYINDNDIWEKVYSDQASSDMAIEVFQYKARPMCYKITAQMCNTPAAAFDTICDLENRMAWDPMCVEARVLDEVAPGTTVQYIRTKAVWPTASRDTVVLGTVKDLGSQGLFMVNASIEYAGMPERAQEKIVRMETAVAGHIITPLDGNRCKLTQIVDADMKGWIPDKVIQMVSTKAVPDGLRAVNKLLPKIESYQKSKVLMKAIKAQMEIDATLVDPRADGNLEDSILKGHYNDLDDDPVERAVEDLSNLDENDDEEDVCQMHSNNNDNDIDGNDVDQSEARKTTHELRRQRSQGDISLSTLAERLRAVEAEIGLGLRRGRPESSSSATSRKRTTTVNSNKETRNANTSGTTGALEKVKPKGMFQVFWDGVKENLGFGVNGKGSKIMVAVIVLAILGSSLAKFKRR
ncbi:START domain-containing protein 10 [Linnemannia zychae]|nr:START domain-containing protein 10 [Linnemannia zychae]